MGKILSGILGGFSGKVGPVVGGKWKDVDYMRAYVIPSNPNTTDQQTVRAKFSALVAIARVFLSTILQVYWDPFYSNMSGFNAFISQNYSKLAVGNILDSDCIMSKGTLEGALVDTAIKTAGSVAVSWIGNPVGNGLLTDSAHAVLYNNESKIGYVNSTPVTREDETVAIAIPTGDDPGDIIAFLFFSRGTGVDFVVSNSDASIVS